jgi:hypothetical protein
MPHPLPTRTRTGSNSIHDFFNIEFPRGTQQGGCYLDLRGDGSERINCSSTLSKVLFFTFKVCGFSVCTFFDT